MTASPVFVSAEASAAVFHWGEAVKILQSAYSASEQPASTPPRTVARGSQAWLRCLPAIPSTGRYFGAKLMGRSNSAAVPGAEYVIVLFDRETSSIAAIVDANLITGYRTAATSAAALDRMAAPGAARLAVLGSGLEASMHVRGFAAVRPLEEVVVFSPTPGRRQAFAETMAAELGVKCRAVAEPAEAVDGATIVLAAARSRGEQPILFGEWLRHDSLVVSIGSTVPEQRELDTSVVSRADFIVCDMLEEVLHETGDMIAASADGIDVAGRAFSLGALMRGQIEPERLAASSPMYKSVGGGLQDVVIAEMVLGRALEAGLATPLPISFLKKGS